MKLRIWLIAILVALAGSAQAQVGGNYYDPTGNAPLAGGSNVTFTKVGNGYKADAAGGGVSVAGSSGNLQKNNGSGNLAAYAGSGTCSAHQFFTALDASGAKTCAQPVQADLSNLPIISANGGTAADLSAAASGSYPKSNGATPAVFAASTLAAAGTGSCTNQFVTATNGDAAPTCTTDTLAGAQHANQGTTTTVLHGNAAGNPSFGAVGLTTDVSGTLPVANGGTNSTTGATALWSGISATIAGAVTTDYISFGEDPGVTVISAQANAQGVVPYAGTASSLYVAQATAGQAGGVVYAVEKNGTPTTLTCTVNNTGDTTHCNDVTHSFTFAAGDLLDVKVINSNAASATGVATAAFKVNG